MPVWTADQARQIFDPTADTFDISYAAHQSDLQSAIALARLKPGHNVLDLGCATGSLALMAKAIVSSGRVVGMDISSELLRVARTKASMCNQGGVEFVEGDITSWQKLQHLHRKGLPRFDVIFCIWVLSNVPAADRRAAIGCWLRLLAPGGRLVLELGTDAFGAIETIRLSESYRSLAVPRRPLRASDYVAGPKWALATLDSWEAGKTALQQLASDANLTTLRIKHTFSASQSGGYGIQWVEPIRAKAVEEWARQGQAPPAPQAFIECMKQLISERILAECRQKGLHASAKNVSWTGVFQGTAR